MHDEGISLRGISASTSNSRQKATEIIELAKKKEEEMSDQWLEEFFFPENSLETSGRKPIDFEYIDKGVIYIV